MILIWSLGFDWDFLEENMLIGFGESTCTSMRMKTGSVDLEEPCYFV